jgi:hypothetical protein
MKHKLLTLLAGVFLFTACNNEKKSDDGKDGDKKETVSASGKEGDKEATSAAPADTAGATQRWMEFMTPGEMHKWLAKGAGTWEGEVHSYMPGAPVDTQKAREVVKMSMNGLYQESDFSSTMMGQPMMGHSTMGYNNMKKMFVSAWIDNMGSGIIMMEGTYDEASKTLNMKGKQSDPGANKETDIRQEVKFADDDNYTMTMYGTGPDGKEMKMMDGTFKRKK